MSAVILASQSPRRKTLLEQRGLVFRTVPADIDETPRPSERPDALVRRLAVTKAVLVGQRYPDALVIGADTVVAFGSTILGKPRDGEHARAMLKLLSGSGHEVYTGVAVWRESQSQGIARVDVAQIAFRSLSLGDIDQYVASGEAMDKAGAYAIQGRAGAWVESYRGNLQTVIGLPTDIVVQLIERVRLRGCRWQRTKR